MHDFPHRYAVTASGAPDGDVAVASPRLPTLVTAPPTEFGGPGDRWSPETMFVAAVADCFILTFRAMARAARLPWESLACDVVGTLDRVDRVTQFTGFQVRATLTVAPGADVDQAHKTLERAEHGCLITNSLKAAVHLETKVLIAAGVS